MFLIRKRLKALLKKKFISFLVLTLVCAIGCAMMITFYGLEQTIESSFDAFLEDYQNPDVVVTTLIQPENIDDYLEEDGISSQIDEYGARIIVDAVVQKSDGRYITGRFYSCGESCGYKLYSYTSETESANDTSSLLQASPNRYFANRNSFKTGDIISVEGSSGTQEVAIGDIVSTPESMVVARNAFVAFDCTDFGYFYMERESMEELFAAEDMVYQYVFTLNDSADPGETAERLARCLESLGVVDYYAFDGSSLENSIYSNLNALEVVQWFMPILYLGIILMFLYLFFCQLILKERRSIAICRALGTSSLNCMALYCTYALCVTTAATLVGVASGFLLNRLLILLYEDLFSLPEIHGFIQLPAILLSGGSILLVGQAAVIFSCLFAFRQNLSAALRGKIHSLHIRKKAGLLQRHLKGVQKVIVSAALRNKRHYILSLLCMIFATMIIVLALSFSNSKAEIMRHNYSERFLYDCQVLFKQSLTDEQRTELDSIEEAADYEEFVYFSGVLEFDGEEEDILVHGLSSPAELVRVYDTQMQEISVPEEGIVLEEELCQRLGIEKGDSVSVNGISVTVADISRENLDYIQYCSLAQAEKLRGESGTNGIFCTLRDYEAETENSLGRQLSAMDGFDCILNLHVQEKDAKSSFDMMSSASVTFLVSAFLIGFLVIYNLTQISLDERKQQYALLRANGVLLRTIAFHTLSEIVLQFVPSALIGILLGNAAGGLLLSMIGTQYISYPLSNGLETWFLAGGTVFLFLCMGQYLAVWKIRHYDLPFILKERE